jgi:hypothetical protein
VFCKRQGFEWVAEQLLASQEGIFSMTLIVIHCNDSDSYIGGNVQSSHSIISYDESVYHSLL